MAVANGLLFLIAWSFAEMSFCNKLSTTDNAVHYFGPVGVKIFALSLLLAKSAWFAIQLEMMGEILVLEHPSKQF